MAEEVLLSRTVAIATVLLAATAGSAAADVGPPVDTAVRSPVDDPARDAIQVWNEAMATATETLKPVQQAVDPVVRVVEEETGQDLCNARFDWDPPILEGEDPSSPPLWCPGGSPEPGNVDPGAGIVVDTDAPDVGPTASVSQGVRPDPSMDPSDGQISVADHQAPAPDGSWDLRLVIAGVLAGLAVWLYRRLSERQLVENPNRQAILGILREEPGRTCAELADRLDLHYNTVRYHLRRLEEFDRVVGRRLHGRDRYYPNGDGDGAVERRVAAVWNVATKRRILKMLLGDGPAASGTLAERLDVAPSTCSEHLRDLAESGLLSRRSDGRRRVYNVTREARQAVRRRS